MIDETVLDPGAARVFRVPASARLALRDLEGHQAVELVAFVVEDPAEYLDCSVTMEIIGRVFPTPGSKFYSNRYEPLLTLLEDEVGAHDLFHPASSALSRSLFLGESGERGGTREAFARALDEAGLHPPHLPRPVHFFRRTDVDQEGSFVMMETPSQPGQGVRLEAGRDLWCAVAVPDDEISPITGCHPTPIAVTIEGVV